MLIRAFLIVFITLVTILVFVIAVTSTKFELPFVFLIAIFISLILVLGPGWPTKDNIKAWADEAKGIDGHPVVGLKIISYFLRLFCAIISINFVYAILTGSIYINIVGRNSHGPLKQVCFHDSPYIFSFAFLISGYVFVKSILWLWPRLKSSFSPASKKTNIE